MNGSMNGSMRELSANELSAVAGGEWNCTVKVTKEATTTKCVNSETGQRVNSTTYNQGHRPSS